MLMDGTMMFRMQLLLFTMLQCPTADAFPFPSPRPSLHHSTALYSTSTTTAAAATHEVQGMVYKEIVLELPRIGQVKLLEATLDTQTKLIDMALAEEEDDDMNTTTLHNESSSSSSPSSSSSSAATASAASVVKEDIYGAVLWPAALTVASYLLKHSHTLLQHQTVVEVGTGTGLVALAAAMGGARHVIATDYEPIPLTILQHAAELNNDAESRLSTQLFDICDSTQILPSNMTLFVAADVLYQPKTGRALARRVVEALSQGAHVVVGDSPGRPGRPAFLSELAELGIHNATFRDISGWAVRGERHELICGKTSQTRSETERALVVAVMHLSPRDYTYLQS